VITGNFTIVWTQLVYKCGHEYVKDLFENETSILYVKIYHITNTVHTKITNIFKKKNMFSIVCNYVNMEQISFEAQPMCPWVLKSISLNNFCRILTMVCWY